MSVRTRFPVFQMLAAVAVVAGASACDSQEGPLGPGGDASPATVEGRVEDGGQSGSSTAVSSSPSPTASYAGSADAATAAVAHVQSDGSLEVLAEAQVHADGHFTIPDVPTGRSDLVVVARASDGTEVGRVLVHGETRAGAVLTTAPINAESTVEGRVFAHLKSEGVREEDRNSAELALLIRMSESTASEVAASAQAIQEVSAGVRAGVEAMHRTYAELGTDVDAEARIEAVTRAAIEYAESRHAGAAAAAAAEAFVTASVDAAIRAGAEAELVSLATAAAVTGLERAMAQVDGSTRLELARNGLRINLEAREQVAALLSSNPSTSLAAGALADLSAEVEASASIDAMVQAVLDAEATFEEDLTAMILSDLSGLSATQQVEIESHLETTFAKADLSASVSSAVTVAEVVQAVIEYRQELRAAVEAYAASLPDDVTVSAQMSAELLMIVHGSPGLGETGS